LISVCLATYNGEKYVAAQVESILASPLVGELLVSDDGSSDRTIDIIERFSDPRIKVFRGPRAGVGKNFEFLLTKARGEYIFLSDQDDIWRPEKVKLMVEQLQQADLVISDCAVVDQDLKVLHPSYFDLMGSRPGFLKNITRNSYLGCCMALRRSLLTHILPLPKTLPLHDWWIGMIAEAFGKVTFLNVSLVEYRRHASNMSSSSGRSSAPIPDRLRRRALMVWFLLLRRLGGTISLPRP
jgi:glycosyltransferase involved in cell wall biosynthesis